VAILETVVVTGSRIPAPQGLVSASPLFEIAVDKDSITNVQEQGVDEGAIVKLRGDILIMLRRGRLFTVSIAGGGLRPVDSIDAYPPGADARYDWYDEMLVSGNRIIVVGYSYGRGGTEINRFRLTSDGRLTFEDAYHLRSDDYYSSRNYASRLIGTRLVFYTPLYLELMPNAFQPFPAFRRWAGDDRAPFRRIAGARDIYISPVVSCDLAAPVFDCHARSVIGPEGRAFYVSPRAVYVWVAPWDAEDAKAPVPAQLYRMPLDGSAPSAVGVSGMPIDQFSFDEDAAAGILNVVVTADGNGDAMWLSERTSGAVSLLRLPLADFGDGTRDVPRSAYRRLPSVVGIGDTLHNRFAGDHLLYGMGTYWGAPKDGGGTLFVTPVRGGPVAQLALPHTVDRIDIMGRDAIVVGADRRNLYFSSVLLGGGEPALGDRYTLRGAAQAETRSHGFFFKAEASTNGDAGDGIIGLPVARPARAGFRQLFERAAALVFLRRAQGKFARLGELAADQKRAVDDNCIASCVDWYGNARPIFIRDRTFALMGYELVEGWIGEDSIEEIARANFAPALHPKAAATSPKPAASKAREMRPVADFASGDPLWHFDESGSCWVRIPQAWGKPQAIAWTGRCQGQRASGHGTLVVRTENWSHALAAGDFRDGEFRRGELIRGDGQRAQGAFTSGMLEGEGIVRFPNGTEFRGTFHKGALDGAGTARYAGGTRLGGMFRNGALVHGTWRWPSGAHYHGALVAGRFHGKGTLVWSNGDRYTGTFAHGLEDGAGRYALADGSTIDCTFRLGIMTGSATVTRPDGAHVTGPIEPPKPDPAHPVPAIRYPAISERLQEEGRVVVRYRIGVDGIVRDVRVVVPSGKDRLDAAAIEWIGRARLMPATVEGIAVPAPAMHVVTFKLPKPPAPAQRRRR
jgi:TonB family protein